MRRRLVVLLVVALLVAAGLVARNVLRSDEPAAGGHLERAGSTELDGREPLDIADEPAGYRITYRVTHRNGSTSTDEVTVRRPFTSETVVRRGEGSGQRTAFGRLITGVERDAPTVLAVGPTLASEDLRVAPSLDDAVRQGLLEVREQREVAGRRCQVYRTGTTVGAGPLQAPTAAAHADICIDARGLLLEEWWVVDGAPFRQRLALDVVERAPSSLGKDWSQMAPSMAVDKGGGSVLRLRDGSAPPGEFFETTEVPSGFEHVGRYTVVPPQAEAFSERGDRLSIVASTVDVWRRGIDVLIVDQGGSLGGKTAFAIDRTNRTVDVAGIGEAEVRIGLAGAEVRALRPGGHFVRVQGTLPVADLLAVMRSLVARQGSELVVDRGAPLLPGG